MFASGVLGAAHASKKDVIRRLKALLKDANELYLATDEDREGEAISWHLLQVLQPKVPVKRMVFNEITPAAIAHAVDNWRDIDAELVNAKEPRRIARSALSPGRATWQEGLLMAAPSSDPATRPAA